MRDKTPPFRFNISSLIAKARRLPVTLDGVSLRLPFLNVSVKPDLAERKAAREVVIRLADRRVLNAFECCDNCIDNAVKSLQEIRALLVSKQMDLAEHTDTALYLLLELMLEAVRQFFTFQERLPRGPEGQRAYFAALEMLRAHLYRCLTQVAAIAEIEVPKIAANMRYDAVWQVEAYVLPELPPGESGAA